VTSSTQRDTMQKSFGVYVQEQLGWRDRLFATGALRVDNNSAFGSELNRVFYPKLSCRYVISEEPFFHVPMLNDLRLRAAWGQAGNAPGPLDAVRSYTSSVVTTPTGTLSALRYGNVGNPDLKPERGSEIEIGFEAAGPRSPGQSRSDLLQQDDQRRAHAGRHRTVDGLRRQSAHESGTISNSGIEGRLTLTLIQRQALNLETGVTLATNSNKLVAFGDERAPIIFGRTHPRSAIRRDIRLAACGRSAFSATRRYDREGGWTSVLDTASVYMGPSVPPREMSVHQRRHAVCADCMATFSSITKPAAYQFNVKDWRRDPRRRVVGDGGSEGRPRRRCWCASSRHRPTCTFSLRISSSCATSRSATICRSTLRSDTWSVRRSACRDITSRSGRNTAAPTQK
jgi:hypothetical protein